MNFKSFDIFKNIRKEEEYDPSPKQIIPMKDGFSGYIVGRPGSGKSTLIKLLLHEKEGFFKKFDLVLFISPYKISDLQIPQDRFTECFSIDWIRERIRYFSEIKNLKKVLVIIDDQIAIINKGANDPDLKELFYNRRKAFGPELSLLITSQRWVGLPPNFRATLQWIIVFQLPKDDFDKFMKEQIFKSINYIHPIISSHFSKYEYNFIFIRLNPYSLHLNFDKIVS